MLARAGSPTSAAISAICTLSFMALILAPCARHGQGRRFGRGRSVSRRRRRAPAFAAGPCRGRLGLPVADAAGVDMDEIGVRVVAAAGLPGTAPPRWRPPSRRRSRGIDAALRPRLHPYVPPSKMDATTASYLAVYPPN